MDEILLNNGIVKIKKTTLGFFKVSIEHSFRRLTVSRLGETLGDAWGTAVHSYSGETLNVYAKPYDTELSEDLEYAISTFLEKNRAKLKIAIRKCTIESYRHLGGKVILANISAKNTHQAINEAISKSFKLNCNPPISQILHIMV